MVLLSLRGKYEDIFWFSFFHEAAHLLLHGKKSVFVEEDGRGRDGAEQEADEFARNLLIPSSVWTAFVEGRRSFSLHDVREAASAAGLSPAIVVGRLQHEERIQRSSMNALRRRIEFAVQREG